MSKYVKNHITRNRTTSTYLPASTENNKKLAWLDTKGLRAEEWCGSPQVPVLGNNCFLSWHAGKAGNVGSYCGPLEEKSGSSPIPVWLLSNSNSLVNTSHGKGVTPSFTPSFPGWATSGLQHLTEQIHCLGRK